MAFRSIICTTFVVCGLVPITGCSSAPETPAASEPTGEVREAIVGGQVTTTCQWPTALHNPNGDNCTNTLIAPKVIMSAGHCYDQRTNALYPVQFGENFKTPGKTAQVDKCYLHPGYTGSLGNPAGIDISFCTLKEPISDVPITPILMGCETSILQHGQDAVLVGFGRTSVNGTEDGRKRFVHVSVDSVDSQEIVLGDETHGGCYGDSGGPAFVKLADGTWRVFGATSRGTGSGCSSQSIYTLLHPIVAWLEQTAGVDVTPCFDADGTWNPGPSCGKFPTAPDSPPAAATWSDGCSGVTVSPTVSTTCGANDAGAPADAGTDAARDAGDGGSSDGGGVTSVGDSGADSGAPSSSSQRGGGTSAGDADENGGASDGEVTTTAGCRASPAAPDGGSLSALVFAIATLRRRRR